MAQKSEKLRAEGVELSAALNTAKGFLFGLKEKCLKLNSYFPKIFLISENFPQKTTATTLLQVYCLADL